MGPWRPSSVPETCRPKKERRAKNQRSSFVPGDCGTQNTAASALGPGLGAQSSPAARRAACARAASLNAEAPPLVEPSGRGSRPRPGPVRGAGTLLTGCRALTPSQRPARKQRRRQGRRRGRRRQLRLRLPGSSAPSRGGGERGCCGWRRPPPLSPYRTRGPDAPGSPPWRLQPGCSLRWRSGQERPPPDRGGSGRKCAGRRREGAGSRPGRAAAAPLAPQSLTPRSPGASTAPSLPGHLLRAAHTDASSTKHHGRRRLRRPPGRG